MDSSEFGDVPARVRPAQARRYDPTADDAANEIESLRAQLAAVTTVLAATAAAHQERWAGKTADDDHVPIWREDSKDLSGLLAALKPRPSEAPPLR